MPETYIYNKEDLTRLLKTATIETDKYGYQTLILKKGSKDATTEPIK